MVIRLNLTASGEYEGRNEYGPTDESAPDSSLINAAHQLQGWFEAVEKPLPLTPQISAITDSFDKESQTVAPEVLAGMKAFEKDQQRQMRGPAILHDVLKATRPEPLSPTLEPRSFTRAQYVHGQKTTLDDDGFAALGNALLLGYLARLVRLRLAKHMSPDLRKIEREADLVEFSDRRALRDAMAFDGAIDDGIEGGSGHFGEETSASFVEDARRWQDILMSNALIARLRVKDIVFPDEWLNWPGFKGVLEDTPESDLRRPIPELGVTPLTRLLKDMVLSYFQEGREGQRLMRHTNDGPEASPKLNVKKSPDDNFVAEGVALVQNGGSKSANEAARILVSKYGVEAKPNLALNKGSIRAASEGAAQDRMQRKINKAL